MQRWYISKLAETKFKLIVSKNNEQIICLAADLSNSNTGYVFALLFIWFEIHAFPWISLSLRIRWGSNEGFACGFVFFKLNDKPFMKYSINKPWWLKISLQMLIIIWYFGAIFITLFLNCICYLVEQTHCKATFLQLSEPWPHSSTANVLFLLQQQILSLACYDCLLNTKEWSSEQSIAVFCLNDIQRYTVL